MEADIPYQYAPTIVVAAYNRPDALKQLLQSLAMAIYPSSSINLIISIDYSSTKSVVEAAEAFNWPYGTKQVKHHQEHLGLKKHILYCGDLTEQYGSIILLEDDIIVSPYFYIYTQNALEYFGMNDHIGGISLYSYAICESSLAGFEPLENIYDNYFIQFPSSWGQCWTNKQWQSFKNWSHENDNDGDASLPEYINDWKSNSWKKLFANYLKDQNKFFVYPKVSLSSNTGQAGTNYPYQLNIYQVQLQSTSKEYQFEPFDKSINKYDIHFEPFPVQLQVLANGQFEKDITIDLYGTKNLADIHTQFILTNKPSNNVIQAFGNTISPRIMNVINGIAGTDFHLSLTEDTINTITKPNFGEKQFVHQLEQEYQHHKLYRWKRAISIMRFNILNRLHFLKNALFSKKNKK